MREALFCCLFCYGQETDTSIKKQFQGAIQRGDCIHSSIPDEVHLWQQSCKISVYPVPEFEWEQFHNSSINWSQWCSSGEFYLITALNPSLCNLSKYYLMLAINPSQILRINNCFLFALFIACLKSIIYHICSLQAPKSLN